MKFVEFSTMDRSSMFDHLVSIHKVSANNLLVKITKDQMQALHNHLEMLEGALATMPKGLIVNDYETRKSICALAEVPTTPFQHTGMQRGYNGSGVLQGLMKLHNLGEITNHFHDSSIDQTLPTADELTTETGLDLTNGMLVDLSTADANRIIKLLNADIEDLRRKVNLDIDNREREQKSAIEAKYEHMANSTGDFHTGLGGLHKAYKDDLEALQNKYIQQAKEFIDEPGYSVDFIPEQIITNSGRNATITVVGKVRELKALADQVKHLKSTVEYNLTKKQRENEALITKSQLDSEASRVYQALQERTTESVSSITESIEK